MRPTFAALPLGALLLATSLAAPLTAEVAWEPAESMTVARAEHAAVGLGGGRVLVLGGTGGASRTGELFAGRWTPTSNSTLARLRPTATLLEDGRVLVTDAAGHERNPEIYDPEGNEWSPARTMPRNRTGGYTLTTLEDGRVLVAGGGAGVATADLYDPRDDSWTQAGSMVNGRSGHTATLLETGQVLVVGGSEAPTAELFDPATREWKRTADPRLPHTGHTATRLTDGQVLVAGGDAAIAEVYEPRREEWRPTEEMTRGRTGHAATLLANGHVLVTGGLSQDEDQASTEIYDPGTNKWLPAAPMLEARRRHSMTATGSATVLVAGGGRGRVAVSTAEIGTVRADVSLEVTPRTSTGLVGSTHTLAAVVREDGEPAAGRPVGFAVTGANPRQTTATTDASGRATFAYTGAAPGTDTIRVTYTDRLGGSTTSQPVTRTWTEATIALAPATSSGVAGTRHTVTATALEGGAPVSGRRVDFVVTQGPHAGTSGTANTGANGTASFGYDGTLTGTDTIRASFTDSANRPHQATATRTWTVPSFTLTASPGTATGLVGTPHTVTATLTENGGPAPAGRPIVFAISGANAQQATRTTNAGGQATFSYTGANPGTDTIRATHNDRFGGSTTSQPVTRTWTEATIALAPTTSTGVAGTSHTVTAAVREAGAAVNNRRVDFLVTQGPHKGASGFAHTGPNGTATFTYPGTLGGTDTIRASFNDSAGLPHQSSAQRTWTAPRIQFALAPAGTAGRVRTTHTITAGLTENGSPPAPGRTVTFTVTGANARSVQVTTDGSANTAFSYTGANPGQDQIRATYVDSVGGAHTTDPVERTWTGIDIVEPPTRPDRDRDGRLDGQDNCPERANADQSDRDTDAIGDVCDTELPSGERPVIVGEVVRVEAIEGEVFIQLPGPARTSARASQAPLPGFRPLKGRATVPVGSVVDARRGTLGLSAAAGYTKGAQRLQSARLSAALFEIRQAKRPPRKGLTTPAGKLATTDFVLRTPPGLARACASTTSPSVGPAKGVVRTMVGSGKGAFRTVGGASTTTITSGNWIVSDRCTGTVTEVGRGTATVYNKTTRQTVKVRSGQRYIAKARLFAAARLRGL